MNSVETRSLTGATRQAWWRVPVVELAVGDASATSAGLAITPVMATNANTNGDTAERQWLTVAQVAEYLGTTRATLYRWRSEGIFPPHVELPKHILVHIDDLETWLVRMRREGTYKAVLR